MIRILVFNHILDSKLLLSLYENCNVCSQVRRTILTLSSSTGEAESEVRMIAIFYKLFFWHIWFWYRYTAFFLQGLIIRGPLIDMNWPEEREGDRHSSLWTLKSWDLLEMQVLGPLETQVLKGEETQIPRGLETQIMRPCGVLRPMETQMREDLVLFKPNLKSLKHNELIILTNRFLSWNKLYDENDWIILYSLLDDGWAGGGVRGVWVLFDEIHFQCVWLSDLYS